MKKLLSVFLSAALMFSMAACGGSNKNGSGKGSNENPTASKQPAKSEDSVLSGEKPELKILTAYQPYNFNEQPGTKLEEEMTGYKVNWFGLPQENADEKLFLEISGGESYDLLLRIGSSEASQLFEKNAVQDLKPLLDKYGKNILAGVSDMALQSMTTEDGVVYAIPLEAFDGPQPGGDPYGILKGGIGFNTKYLEELGKDIPTNLDELYDVLKAYTDKTGKPAFTTFSTGWLPYIMSGFGMGEAGWYEVDGEYLPRIKVPATVDYLGFMQKLYKEGLLDNDMPINTGDTAKEKFTNGTTLAYPVKFFDIDGIYDAFQATGSDTKVKIATPVAKDADTKPPIFVNQGIKGAVCVPKTAKNPEHAINWFNMISDKENFRKIYIGEEGESYEIKDDKYYPIFPAFDDFTNSDKLVGVVPTDDVFKMWQARARKTDAAAELYDDINSRVGDYDVENYYESYASSLPAVRDNETALNTMTDDKMIQAITSGEDPQKAIDNIIAEWDKTGGKEYEAAMQKWHEENKDTMK